MHLTTRFLYLLSHILNDDRQFVCAYMRMCVCKNVCRGTKLTEHVENLLYIASFLTSGIEFTITICTSPSFSETVVRLIIHFLFGFDTGEILLSFTYILSALNDNRTKAMLYKAKGSKETCRSLTHHNNLLAIAHIRVFCHGICKVCRFLINVCTNGEVDIDLTLTRINATTDNTNSLDGTCINTFLFGNIIDDKRRV